jgi:threonine dehydratase
LTTVAHEPITGAEVMAARERISGWVVRTPLVRLKLADTPTDIYLKLESLQPIGAFKLRGAANRILRMRDDELANGVWTASSGNMARAVAWCARKLGIPCTVVIPEDGSPAKVAAAERLGALVVRVGRHEFYDILVRRSHEGLTGAFVHPFSDRDVMAGNGTIGLEIAEDLPDVQTVLAGYGGGGLTSGIASALRAVAPHAEVIACEPETAAPLASAWRAGHPVEISYTPTFIDGAGAGRLYPEMWELARALFARSEAVPVEEVRHAVGLLARTNAIVAEGAGALPVAAALQRRQSQAGKICCVVSGGNIDPTVLAEILEEQRA